MKLPVLYPQDLIRIVQKMGFREARQKGSHKIFEHADGRILLIAFHAQKPIPLGLLNKIIKKELQTNREKFQKYL
ncbi:MAG: type II toxin-antitoxin system HicA family toxin [Candidatus Micrarchaeota archaeon]